MSAGLIVGLIVIGVLGIAMASVGIQFYRKCEKGQQLNKTNYQWLIGMLVGFCLIVVFALGSGAVTARNKR